MAASVRSARTSQLPRASKQKQTTMLVMSYGELFARVYNQRWTAFAEALAPAIRSLYERSHSHGDAPKSLLDIGCGTGQLARHFLDHGYEVLGLDLSADMLRHAERNNARDVAAGRARFLQADAASFTVSGSFTLAVATYDALNHLQDMSALRACFGAVHAALADGGSFVFDLNTRAGLLKHWNSIQVDDTEALTLIGRSLYDGGAHATMRITGYLQREDGAHERFCELFSNTVFELSAIAPTLREAGFGDSYFATQHDLASPLADIASAESLERVFVVARK